MNYEIRILENIPDLKSVERLQQIVWPGSELDVIPSHLMLAVVENGGLIIGAFDGKNLIGFVFGFAGLVELAKSQEMRHASHALAVHPDYRGQGVGFALKRAQWQMVRHQGIPMISWTYDPLLSVNAHLNITRLGAVCSTYRRNYYGEMRDGLNEGVSSDRFVVEWWLNSYRVQTRLSRRARRQLDLAHYLAASVNIINPSTLTPAGLPSPGEEINQNLVEQLQSGDAGVEPIVMLEIPSDFQFIRKESRELATRWRLHTRELFEHAFRNGFLVTDFLYLPGAQPRSFYVLSKGDATLSGRQME